MDTSDCWSVSKNRTKRLFMLCVMSRISMMLKEYIPQFSIFYLLEKQGACLLYILFKFNFGLEENWFNYSLLTPFHDPIF